MESRQNTKNKVVIGESNKITCRRIKNKRIKRKEMSL